MVSFVTQLMRKQHAADVYTVRRRCIGGSALEGLVEAALACVNTCDVCTMLNYSRRAASCAVVVRLGGFRLSGAGLTTSAVVDLSELLNQ